MSALQGQGKLHGLGDAILRVSFSAATRGLELETPEQKLVLDWKWLTVTRGGFQDQLWVVMAEHGGRSLALYVEAPLDFAERLLELRGVLPPLLVQQLETALARDRALRSPARKLKIAAAVVAVVAAVLWVVPSLLASVLARNVPDSWEQSIGRSGASELLDQYGGACSGSALVQPVAEITRRLLDAAQQDRERFRLFVLDTPQVNAFALPGGYVFVCRGLIEQAESPAELAGVMAHEIQHVLLHHGMRNVIHRAGLGLMLRLLVGDDGGFGVLAQGAASLSSLSFSRGQESEADEHGLELLVRAGFAPDGLVTFFQRLAKQDSGLPALLSTHPASANRAATLRERIAEMPEPALRPLKHPWPTAEAPCEAVRVGDPDASPGALREPA